MGKCKYCNSDREYLSEDEWYNSLICKRVVKDDYYLGMNMGITRNKLSVFVVIPVTCGGKEVFSQFEKEIEIKYCPMCGRELAK